MDEIDQKLLAALAENARLPVATLARRFGLARSTVQARIDRLEARGVIAGYALRLGEGAAPAAIRATVLLTLEPRATAAVVTRLKSMRQVEAAYTASGRFDLVVMIAARSTAELDDTLDRIGEIDGVRGSESLIHLSTKIDRRG
jgi:DNA-binding Lrp family transcriptional regulator